MLSAIFAVMVQGILVWNSQISAAVGLMPQPAVMIGGDAHYHDPLGGNVHHHPTGDADGHVHTPSAADHDTDQPDCSACVAICSMVSASISFPSAATVAAPPRNATSLELSRAERRRGIDPAALIRPPRPFRIV